MTEDADATRRRLTDSEQSMADQLASHKRLIEEQAADIKALRESLPGQTTSNVRVPPTQQH